jgi:hypothetical protein
MTAQDDLRRHLMIFPVTGSLTAALQDDKQLKPVVPAKKHVPTDEPKHVPQTSSVRLSIAEEVRALRKEGEFNVQIAARLNISTKEVDGDLNVALLWPVEPHANTLPTKISAQPPAADPDQKAVSAHPLP